MEARAKRLVLLIAGTGATAQGVFDAVRWGTLNAEVVAVFSNEPFSYGLIRAEREGLPALLHDLADFRYEGRSESDYIQALGDRIAAYEPDLIILAGWQFPLTEAFCERFRQQIVNLHAGLPGSGPAFDPYRRNPASVAFEAFSAGLVREAQVAVEWLEEMPYRRIIAEERVPIYEFDTVLDVEERMGRVEQELLVNTLALLLRDNESPTDVTRLAPN